MVRLNRGLLSKLLRLKPAAWADLWSAQFALVRAQLLLWTRRRGELLAPAAPVPAIESGAVGVPPEVARLALATERAAEHGLFRPTCLVHAIALQRLLTSRGFAGSSVRVGVRMQHGGFLAHAWVDYHGATLADRAWHVRGFDELARMDVVQPS